MKKHIFRFAALLCTAALGLTSCIIDDPVAGPIVGGGKGPDTPVSPSAPSDAHIDIDGDFSDWDALDKLDLFEFVAPADAASDAAYKMRAAYNADYLYVYLEYDGSEEHNIGILDFYMDSDAAFENGEATTGFGGWLFANDGSDMLFEGEIDEFDPEVFAYSGEPMSGTFTWSSMIEPGTGVVKGSRTIQLDNGRTAVEFSISRAVPGMGDKCLIGAVFQKADWSGTAAMLPVGSAVEGTNVIAEKMLIDFTKRNVSDTPTPSNAHIDIDGDFSDWEALDKLDLFEFIAPDDMASGYAAGKKMRAAYNDTFVYLYFEYDGSEEAGVGILDLYIDTDAAFDAKGFATTGAGTWVWANDGSELLIQGPIAGEDGETGYDPDIFLYSGTPLGNEWAWTEALPAGSGAIAGSKAIELDNGNKAVEISLLRSAIPGLGSKMLIGALFEKGDWSGNCGALPAMSANSEGGYVAAEKMLIDFTRRNTVEPPTPVESDIKIDGDLSDWDGVDTYVATMPDDAHYKGARKLKVATDKSYIYLYVEYDNSEAANVGILDVWLDTDMAFDAAGLATTGCGSWIWNNDGSEYMIQGQLFDENKNGGWAYADVNMYSGTPLANEWAWTAVLAGGMGATNSSKAVDLGDGISAIEASIMRSAIPGLGSQVMLGIMLETAGWSESGVLPQLPADENGSYSAAEKLTIILP